MSTTDDEGKDLNPVASVENVVPVRPGLAVDDHELHAAVLPAGQVQLLQQPGQGSPLGQLNRRPPPVLLRQERAKARKKLHLYGYAQAESLSRSVFPPDASIILQKAARSKPFRGQRLRPSPPLPS